MNTERSNAGRPIPMSRDSLGRAVREAWVRWARSQPCPKPSWLVDYDDLAEEDREADRQIGEHVARLTLLADAAGASMRDECVGWRRAADEMPPKRKAVLVLTAESYLPFTGYWKDNGDGPYWIVPGHGGTVEWWCDCIPPLPDAGKEAFRRSYER